MRHPMTDDVVSAALSLVPCIHAAREEGEATRRVPPALAEALAAAGRFQMHLPHSMGDQNSRRSRRFGHRSPGKANGSVGWCTMIATAVSLLAGWLPAEVGRALCGQPSDLRVAGLYVPRGRRIRSRGATGFEAIELRQWHHPCQLAALLLRRHGRCHTPQTPTGAPQTRALWVPAEAATIQRHVVRGRHVWHRKPGFSCR